MKNLHRNLAGVALAASLSLGTLQAQEPTLEIGAPAPALNIAEWVKGDAIPTLSKGQIYVIEFWATW